MVGRWLWPLLIAVAVVAAVVVTAAGDETRVELEYLDEIGSQVSDLSRSGASIRDVMPRLRDVDREEFTTVFDSVRANLEVALAFVADDPPTESLIPIWALYRQTITAWDDGANGLAASILEAADNPDEALVVNLVGDALADLRAGDNLFKDLKVEFEREEIPQPVSPLVSVQLFPADGGILSLSASYVAAARTSTNSLGLRPGLKVSQIRTDPAWQLNIDSQPVVPGTDSITFSVVITNSGNVASEIESLQMTLRGGAEPIVDEVEVPVLRPDGQTTVTFDPVEVLPDVLYEIEVELNNPGLDSNLDDNKLRVQFTVNPA